MRRAIEEAKAARQTETPTETDEERRADRERAPIPDGVA